MTSNFLQWDIFCHVIDNHGDLGVSWRLAVDLAQRGNSVRIWIDDVSALRWMAPLGHPKVEVLKWSHAETMTTVGDVVIETFGCRIPAHMEGLIAKHKAIWINLEYLSAEDFVVQSHRLPSPVMHGPAKGRTKWFFYPGFVTDTGGLIRENDMAHRHSVFDRTTWLAEHAPQVLNTQMDLKRRLISLFCYEPSSLEDLLIQLANDDIPSTLLVTQGRSQQAVIQALQRLQIPNMGSGNLQIEQLPYLSQVDYDHLLWTCDLNFVRGEDSVVRALWAGKPFVWQIYPQDDQAHHVKLDAFCNTLKMPHDLVELHGIWNGISRKKMNALRPTQLLNWTTWVCKIKADLGGQYDLVTQLEQFVSQKR